MSDPHPEPIFNAPWPALVAAASILLPQILFASAGPEAVYAFALEPKAFWRGDWTGVVTMLFVHGGWLHALSNAVFALAFGAPVARVLGLNGRGGGIFFLFYLACGVLSGIGFAAIHPDSMDPVVGASGAISGLMGAAARTLDNPGRVGPMLGPRVLSLGLGWLIVNLIMALTGGLLTLGTGNIAWEAHLIGFVVGVPLMGVFAHWARGADAEPH